MFCLYEHVCVATKMILVAALANDTPQPPSATHPPSHLGQQHNTCVRLGETTLDKPERKADGIRTQN